MSLATHRLPFAPMAGTAQKRDELLQLVFLNFVSPYLRKHIKHAPRTSHTNALGNLEVFAARLPPGTAIALGVSDGSVEYALSELAGRHWLDLAIAALSVKRRDWKQWLAAFGYEPGNPGDVVALLETSSAPLVEVGPATRPRLVAVTGKATIVSDTSVGPASFADLDARDRAAVERVAKSKVCECFLCKSLRKKL
jgi:hypothetical protein